MEGYIASPSFAIANLISVKTFTRLQTVDLASFAGEQVSGRYQRSATFEEIEEEEEEEEDDEHQPDQINFQTVSLTATTLASGKTNCRLFEGTVDLKCCSLKQQIADFSSKTSIDVVLPLSSEAMATWP
ncbi:unnamed protein product [Soboliphyme baturini]|uniref:Uncharacterized protein n=1 Tax=Soboliphyme baturini TaxID=241478 RepID=A0A183JAL7_9BILA|nr:unnamed protein product [Soboliphyme baturini]